MLGTASYKVQRRILIGTFLLAPLALLFVFTLLPVLNMFYYSLLEWKGLGDNTRFVGLGNYSRIFSNPEYFSVLTVSLYYLLGTFLQLALALFFATLISYGVRFREFFKGVMFFPFLMNGVAIGFIFLYFYRPDGTLDSFLRLIGAGDAVRYWLRNPGLINISLAATSVWRYMGFNFVIFLGAIQSIPGEIYDAAAIDGANKWQQFLYIIYPSIKRIVQLNLILAINGAISVFEIPYIMTGGNNGSRTFVIQTVETAFKYNKFGLASAMAVVLFFIVLLVTGMQNLFFKKEDQ
ncbi:ABC transporter permease [Spirochaeta lutea]|uniref:ABC transporter permease n=2 Tax=Spirochaeta lutea TaxID=1480694 RepID=A0A098QV67_9SPIO|nr:ABC transporter permease [Spirochaeta lutea]